MFKIMTLAWLGHHISKAGDRRAGLPGRFARPYCPAGQPGCHVHTRFTRPDRMAGKKTRQPDAKDIDVNCEKVSKFKMKTTYSARPGCTGAATHEPTRPAGQRKSIALQWIFTEILRCTGPVRVPRQTSRTARPGCPGVTNDNRIARPGRTAGQPGRATRLVCRRLKCSCTDLDMTFVYYWPAYT